MRIKISLLAVAAVCAAVITAPVATAAPQCINTGPTTTQCENTGNAQIVTSPRVTNYNNYPWWFGSGFVIDLGGWRR